jgi:putative endonuclease
MNGASVYIILCADGSYYTGLTREEVSTRFSQHMHGIDPNAYSFSRRPLKLVWNTHFDRIDEAIATESRIKGWSRVKKKAMMRGDLDLLPELAARKNKKTNTEPSW